MFCHYCREFLLNDLPGVLEDAPLAFLERTFFMRNSGPGYLDREVRDFHNSTYHYG
jgi:hypothetical protein